MEKQKLDYFRDKLISLRGKILDDVTGLENDALNQTPKDQSGDLSGYSIHLADVASDSYERELSLTLASKEQMLLNDIDDALSKIESGTYGRCEICPNPIGEDRLEAIPYARLCLKCKQRLEKRKLRA